MIVWNRLTTLLDYCRSLRRPCSALLQHDSISWSRITKLMSNPLRHHRTCKLIITVRSFIWNFTPMNFLSLGQVPPLSLWLSLSLFKFKILLLFYMCENFPGTIVVGNPSSVVFHIKSIAFMYLFPTLCICNHK